LTHIEKNQIKSIFLKKLENSQINNEFNHFIKIEIILVHQISKATNKFLNHKFKKILISLFSKTQVKQIRVDFIKPQVLWSW
jgi:hypothetical protein